MKTLDLFAGAGGWDVAAGRLGHDVDRVEIWKPANATAAAAGMTTIHDDVTTFETAPGEYELHLGSPSCKKYSAAGTGEGRRALDQVLRGVQVYGRGNRLSHGHATALIGDADAALTLEPLRIALDGLPTFIAWEQTPAVLPIWKACADVLRRKGYSVVTAVLNAEQYGVPQTRRRAVLMARRDGYPAELPTPTHSRYWNRSPERLDSGVKPWVSMAEALGWTGELEVISNYGTGGDPTNRGIRHQDEPFAAVTSKADRFKIKGSRWHYRAGAAPNSAVRPVAHPAPALAFGHNPARHQWVEGWSGERAHDTLAGHTESIRITHEEAAVLQTFPADHPWQGNKGQIFQQIGNAVPPLLAETVISALTA